LFIKNKISNLSIKSLPLPDKFFIFIKGDINHIKLRVKINQRVLRGQPLFFSNDFNVPMHAPTSGWIEDISFNSNSSKKYKNNIKIIVASDYLDQWIKLKPIQNYKKYTPEKLIKIINNSGIVGLGGGEFSSAKKLIFSINKVNTLIVNAVESEPYITSDNCLINNYTHEILTGCKIISWITKIKLVLIAIQEDSLESISKIQSVIENEPLFKICILKKKYPGGSSKVLIKSLTGKETPYGKHSIDIGYLVFNVATIFSIKRAIVNGEPLTERIVTFLGEKKFLSGNFWIRVGTPIKYFLTDNKLKKCFIASIFLGGPFMGKRIYDMNYSVLKSTNCISIFFKKEQYQKIHEEICIRCSYCSSVCPVNLLPQQLYWYSKNKNHKQTKKHYILDCIECKACEKVCPSYIPLVKYFKQEKIFLKNNILEDNRKKIALIRFKEREKRLLIMKKTIDINYDNVFSTEKKDKNIHDINRNIRRRIVEEAIERMQAKK